GLEVLELFQSAVFAQDTRHSQIDASLAVTENPLSDAMLPLLGFRRTHQRTPEHLWEGSKTKKPPREYEAWEVSSQERHFIMQLQRLVAQTIQRQPNPDGALTETVHAADLESAWQQAGQHFSLLDTMQTPAAQAIQIGAALAACTIGIPWTVSPDGTALTRSLPAHPLRLPATRDPLCAVYGTGERATWVACVAWAVLPANNDYTGSPMDEILMASFVGWQKLLKGIWAAMMDRKRSPIALPYLSNEHSNSQAHYRSARRLEGKRRYQTFWNERPLARSGLAHIVIEANAVCQPMIGRPFAHIVGRDGHPDFARFARQLDAALRLPIRPAWAADLWQLASAAESSAQRPQLITPLPSHGCSAYWVRADLDTAWAPIIAGLAGASGDHAGAIERTGTLHTTVATLTVPESDEDEDRAFAA
ncbi:MAG TPA: hypothetical protein VGJ87_04460, partial [Roseiflexaceae bacterium]